MYALLTVMLVTTNINGVATHAIEWNPEPVSVHKTWRLCKFAYYDKAGFKRRLTDKTWLRYSPVLKCEKIKHVL
jgi:hypothetical protein